MDEKKVNNRQIQAAKTKRKIYDAAMKLIHKNGLDQTTIREICKKSGVSVGTFYLYYTSKEDIVLERIRSGDKIFETMSLPEKAGMSWDKSVTAVILEWLKVRNYEENAPMTLDPKFLNKYVITENSSFFRTLNSIIAQGQREGGIRTDLESKNIAWKIVRFARGLEYDWHLHCREYDLKDMVSGELDFYLTLFKSSSKNM